MFLKGHLVTVSAKDFELVKTNAPTPTLSRLSLVHVEITIGYLLPSLV